jgi:molybdopterin synthase sulfur carrier subunit
MATVSFTPQLERFLPAPTVEAAGTTLHEVLTAVFREHPALKGYVLDDQGAVRQHVAIFINGDLAVDRVKLTDPVGPNAEIYVLQALTGG